MLNESAKELPCPACGYQLSIGIKNCPKCSEQLYQETVFCPDCDAENLVFADARDVPCQAQCGAQIPVASLLGFLPEPKQFCTIINMLSGFHKFSKQQTLSGDIYYELETSTTSLQVWQVSTNSHDNFVTKAQKARDNLKNQILLPTQVIEPTGVTDYLLVYQKTEREKSLKTLEPVDLAIALFELIEPIHKKGFCVPALTPEDLDVTQDGKIRLLLGHKLCPQQTKIYGNFNPDFTAPELNIERVARRESDIFTLAKIWYWVVSKGILGHSQPDLDKIPCPRIWYPDMPVGLWGILLACLQNQFEQRPQATSVLSLLRQPRQSRESVPVKTIIGMHRDVGRKPDQNQEDACDCDETEQIAVVSDGVSQSGWGEKASETVVKILTKNHVSEMTPEKAGQFLQDQINKANAAIGQCILEDQEKSRQANQFSDPMSATVVAAYLLPDFVTVASLGDSRAYLLSAGNYLERLTEDQNGRWEYLKNGESFADAAAKEDANSLARWVGDFEQSSETTSEIDPNRPRDVDCQLVQFQWLPGDKLLLCSDGVHDFLTDSEIADILKQSDDPDAIARKLVSEAMTAQDTQGKGDNVAALVVVVKEQNKLPQTTDFYQKFWKRYPFAAPK
jgi:protein phosphatase